MGHRVVKRVPLDFDAPIGKTWPGYLSPDWRPCPSDDCDKGYTLAAAWLGDITHLIMILADAPKHGLHPWLEALPLHPDKAPKENIRELTGGLAGREYRMIGHAGSDRWKATKTIIKAAGLPENWGTCAICNGHAIHPDDIEASEAWEETEPPEGDGWQLWETTSEGSPVSPVFATPEELANWCADNATAFADFRWSAAEWLRSFQAGTTDTDSLLVVRIPEA
jgi:hypothetical protein